jgi:hypothetical protein
VPDQKCICSRAGDSAILLDYCTREKRGGQSNGR